jgi:uncharacterized repeat protein (TIGR03803 family)
MKRAISEGRWTERVARPAANALAICVPLVALGVLTCSPLQAQSYKVLFSFVPPTGSYPSGHLIRDAQGNFYGTTSEGGITNTGVVFKVDATGRETLLHDFGRGIGAAGGAYPGSGVIMDSAGNLYGTTTEGGPYNFGVAFKLDPTGVETVLHNFTGGADGANPWGALLPDAAGNLYGATEFGGVVSGSGPGVVFKLDSGGNETVLYSFTGGADGAYPLAGPIRDTAGHLYGTTSQGGAYGSGVVFKLDAPGKETVLWSFTGGLDGGDPVGELIQDGAGNLYGTTEKGGAYGAGVVFKLDPAGNETVLYSFTGGADGGTPVGPLVRDAAGNLYGTTYEGGIPACSWASGCGTVFRISGTGTQTLLYSFTGTSSGTNPSGGLIQVGAGNIYGTTAYLGPRNGNGVLFEISRN